MMCLYLKSPQDAGKPRRGASKNHIFCAAIPECPAGRGAEGYMIVGASKAYKHLNMLG